MTGVCMNDVIRWRSGDAEPVIVPVPEGVRIDAGTLLYMDKNGEAIPYRLFVERHQKSYRASFDMDIESDIHGKFLGVSLSGNIPGIDGNPSMIRVATRGFFEFDVWTNQDRVLPGQNVYLRPMWDGITWNVSDDSLTMERLSECFFPPMGRIAQTKLVNATPTPTRIKIHSNIL